MFFINHHEEVKNIDNDFNLRNDLGRIKNMIIQIENEKFSYYHLCKKYITFKNKYNLLFFLKFDIKKKLNNLNFILNIYFSYDNIICNKKECIKFLCNNNYHYNISKSNLIKILTYNDLDELIKNFPLKLQDINKCDDCEKLWDIESDIRYFEKDKKYDFSKCDSCKFNQFIRIKTLKSFENCSICLNKIFEDTLKITKCNHTFHKDCIETWLITNKKCPLCRTKLKDNIEPDFML